MDRKVFAIGIKAARDLLRIAGALAVLSLPSVYGETFDQTGKICEKPPASRGGCVESTTYACDPRVFGKEKCPVVSSKITCPQCGEDQHGPYILPLACIECDTNYKVSEQIAQSAATQCEISAERIAQRRCAFYNEQIDKAVLPPLWFDQTTAGVTVSMLALQQWACLRAERYSTSVSGSVSLKLAPLSLGSSQTISAGLLNACKAELNAAELKADMQHSECHRQRACPKYDPSP